MTKPRTIIRRITVEVEFHHADMMRVVHNSQYLKWFEKGRLNLLDDVIPLSWAIENGIAVPVVMNHVEYFSPAVYGDTLVVTTKHRLADRWDGRFLFEHSISNTKTKVELCAGQTAVTVIDLNSNSLIKEIPQEIWARYQALK
jgi:acyl-CoA thioester hydrolase